MKLESDMLVMDFSVKTKDPQSREVAELVMKTFFNLTSSCLQMPDPIGITLLKAYFQEMRELSRRILHEIQCAQLDGELVSEKVN